MQTKKVDIFARKYEMCDFVYNKAKQKVQIVLSKIPFDKKEFYNVPKLKDAYICSDTNTRNWEVELGENLRPVTMEDAK